MPYYYYGFDPTYVLVLIGSDLPDRICKSKEYFQ